MLRTLLYSMSFKKIQVFLMLLLCLRRLGGPVYNFIMTQKNYNTIALSVGGCSIFFRMGISIKFYVITTGSGIILAVFCLKNAASYEKIKGLFLKKSNFTNKSNQLI